MKKVIPAQSGQWYYPSEGHFTNVCCKCGLEHQVELLVAPIKQKDGSMKIAAAIRFFLVKPEKNNLSK
jgi:hypothetical protein